jgi:adenosine deaminase
VQEGIEEGEDAVDRSGRDIRVGQLITAMRHADRSLEIARLAVAFRGRGAVGFDIAGAEDGFPPSRHRAAFDYLASEFFPVTVHAGEAAGLDSIRSAILDGRALRLGHGVRIAEDLEIVQQQGDEVLVTFGDLARWVRDREIPLELSPSSNLQTGAIAAWGTALEDHPFDLLYQLGFAVTVNVDNRTMSRTSLTRELALLAETFDYRLEDLEAFQLNAAAGAFCRSRSAKSSSSSSARASTPDRTPRQTRQRALGFGVPFVLEFRAGSARWATDRPSVHSSPEL